MVLAAVTEQTFGAEHFGNAQLGDARRTRRLVRVADRFLAHPQGSLPHKCQDPAMYQALLGLLTPAAVTHRAVLGPHCDLTLRRMRQHPGTVIQMNLKLSKELAPDRVSLTHWPEMNTPQWAACAGRCWWSTSAGIRPSCCTGTRSS